jgi:Caspase domain
MPIIPVAMTAPKTSTIYATKSGGTTLDQDDCGGNPFATALIELSQRQGLNLRQLLPALRQSTLKKSANLQEPTWDHLPPDKTWTFPMDAGTRSERRIALVLIVSDYLSRAGGRLLGAANDERRIAAMLAGHGFSVIQGIAPNRQSLLDALRSFAMRSKSFDVAVLYSTGHGVELEGRAYLLPGDYPLQSGCDATLLTHHALPVDRITAACRARKVNLTFFAGCRSEVGVSR